MLRGAHLSHGSNDVRGSESVEADFVQNAKVPVESVVISPSGIRFKLSRLHFTIYSFTVIASEIIFR